MPEFFFHVGIDLHRAADDGAAATAASSGDYIRQRFGDVAQVVEESSNDEADAGTALHAAGDGHDGRSSVAATLLGSPASSGSSQPPGSRPEDDCRAGALVVRSVDMAALAADATRAVFEPADSGDEALGWGVIRLYRERDEAPGLEVAGGGAARSREAEDSCATLCVLAVPSYMTPSDFLGFVGEDTRAAVSHFRMLRTERINRYMVLMRFRSGRRARAWRREWNGRPFNDIESENCHVVFVRSIKFRGPPSPRSESSFPHTHNDPFAPTPPTSASQSALSTRPMAPPTPALKELPTCPVCLERMDESTGLLTILCRHVFHCSCLQKWRGSGCPVCRFTQDGTAAAAAAADAKGAGGVALKDGTPRECSVCHSDLNLWVCLICGNVGCGRYDGAHAFAHHRATSHPFAMDVVTQRVWDYAEDGYVHRILQSKSDGKLLELPSIPAADGGARRLGVDGARDDVSGLLLPAEKLDALSLEYSYLLTSQLDSQRLYFEEKLERAADKARLTADDARDVRVELDGLRTQFELAKAELEKLKGEQRDRDRAVARADRFEAMARKMEREWREEKAVSEGLKERVEYLNDENKRLTEENVDLKDQNRDLNFFISGAQQLANLKLGDEVTDAKVEVPEEQKKKKKGKKR